MEATRREFMVGAAAAGAVGATGCGATVPPEGVLTPEAFGARGDGRTNDTAAFAALSEAVNARGSAVIDLRPVTYIVGKHVPRGTILIGPRKARSAFSGADILHFVNCQGPVIVRGNGATMRAEGGLRFGAFDPETGRRFDHSLPFTIREFAASPYSAMILAERCSGIVEITDIDLDGNLPELQIGGQFGNKGWQIPATGIRLIGNSGPERLARIRSHHHALDGITIEGVEERSASSTLTDVTCDFNARQGCSIIGGQHYAFSGCNFRNTGRAGLHSGPGAGVDIEAERGKIRDIAFSNCDFSDNAGVGMVASAGDSADVSFNGCRFVGVSNWSAWPQKPGFRFANCLFAGALVNAYGDRDKARAATFHGCRFTDDPSLTSAGQLFGGRGRDDIAAELHNSPNVLFEACSFELAHGFLLPSSSPDVIYSGCRMTQSNPKTSHPRGTYVDSNYLTGNIDLSGSIIRGRVILNGRQIADDGSDSRLLYA